MMKIKLQNLPHGVKLFGSVSRARILELLFAHAVKRIRNVSHIDKNRSFGYILV
jgi:hypothetical protein